MKSTEHRARQEYPKLARQTAHELRAIESERRRLISTEYNHTDSDDEQAAALFDDLVEEVGDPEASARYPK